MDLPRGQKRRISAMAPTQGRDPAFKTFVNVIRELGHAMIRLLLVLCAAIFVTLQIGGDNAGAKPLGLVKHVAPRDAQAPDHAPQRQTQPPAQLADAARNPMLINASMTGTEATPPARAMTRPLTRPSLERLSAESAAVGADDDLAAADATMPEGATQPGAQDVYYVKGRGVNVRSHPSSRSAVVGKLGRGEAVTVVWVEPNGWARIRIEGDGIEGYMAKDFLATRD